MRTEVSTRRKAAIYLRISQDREMDGPAIERQREQCEALAKFRGWEVVEPHYVDRPKSATGRTEVRPAYNQMVEDYRAGAFTAIICYDLDRLAHEPRQLEDWIDAVECRGLALMTANGDSDMSTDGRRMSARIKATMARGEMERKSARQTAAQAQRAKQGQAPKGMRPFGYSDAGDLIAHEATTVAAMYAAFAHPSNPESLRSLARALSGDYEVEGITRHPRHTHTVSVERADARKAEGLEPRPVKPDGEWAPSTVLGILRNPRYAGYSTYTPKQFQADGGKRRSWKATILRDDAGEPIRGQWEPAVSEELWWQVQMILDDKDRVTNTSGSTKRKHLGSGLYRCSVCGGKVTGAARGYRCAGHVMRTGSYIDDFVTRAIAKRLRKRDAIKCRRALEDSPAAQGIAAEISTQRARITRAQHDYDAELIEGADLKRIRDAATKRIVEIEAQRALAGSAGALAPILGAADPAQAFLDASLEVRRRAIDVLARVTLLPQPRGHRGFKPDSVVIEWRADEEEGT